MNNFPWGVVIILGSGLIFTMWCIYYILRMAYLETKNEHNITKGSDSEGS
jgi:hypothetical protein